MARIRSKLSSIPTAYILAQISKIINLKVYLRIHIYIRQYGGYLLIRLIILSSAIANNRYLR